MEKDIEQIRTIVNDMAQRFQGRGGDIQFAGIDDGTVKVAPTGYCWR